MHCYFVHYYTQHIRVKPEPKLLHQEKQAHKIDSSRMNLTTEFNLYILYFIDMANFDMIIVELI